MSITHGGRGGSFAEKNSLKEIRKALEKAAIKAYYAPPIKEEHKSLEKSYDESNSTLAVTTKSSVMALAYQLDTAIEGVGRVAIDKAIETHSADFEDI